MRGVIAAAVCAASLVILGLVVKFRYRTKKSDVPVVSYDKSDDRVEVGNGIDNPAVETKDEE